MHSSITSTGVLTLFLFLTIFHGACGFRSGSRWPTSRGLQGYSATALEAKSKTNFGSFGMGGKVLVAIALSGFVKARFSTQELRSTTVCPSGPGSDVVLETFQKNDPSYHCLPLDQLASKLIFSPLILPGMPGYDSTPFQGARGLPNSTPLQSP
jgi:hypothetical protein